MSFRADDFSERYRRMADGELIELAGEQEQLVPEARTALATELANRGITPEMVKAGTTDDDADDPAELADDSPIGANYLRAGMFGVAQPREKPSNELVVVFSAESEAEAAQASLAAAGIESQLQIVVLVAGDKAEDALDIISPALDDGGKPTDG